MAKKLKQKGSTGKSTILDALEAFRKVNKSDIVLMGADADMSIPTISFGSIKVDIASGVGGAPNGRIIELFGPESSGKTTLAIMTCAAAQKAGGKVVFVDAEHALDPSYCQNLGLNMSEVLLSQPSSGEEALEIVDSFSTILSYGDIIVVDSVAALVPKAEIDGDMGDSHMGLQARLMSQACRKLSPQVSKSGVTLLFINQLRSKIGVTWGSNEVTTGGNALKFYASLRIDVRRTGSKKDSTSGEIIHNKVKIKFVKNKVAPPFREAETIIRFGEGIPRSVEILDLALDPDLGLNVIELSGAWYKYKGENVAQGAEKAATWLEANPEIMDELDYEIRGFHGLLPGIAKGTKSKKGDSNNGDV